MNWCKLVAGLFSAIFIAGCLYAPAIVVADKYHTPLNHNKIMTICVVKSGDDSIRLIVERTVTNDLHRLGYNAIRAVDQFGPKGLAGLGEQETYLKLCEQGIDAVLVIALIDKTKETQLKRRRSYGYPDDYYYKRIWSYKEIQADLSDHENKMQAKYFWEAILFNLSTLEAECTIQSPTFSSPYHNKAQEFKSQLVRRMTKEKIFEFKNKPRKPF